MLKTPVGQSHCDLQQCCGVCQVSNWRKGQVIHWEEGTETLVVGPPPLHCKAGGEFIATLKHFADLRIIAEPHAPPASNKAGVLTHDRSASQCGNAGVLGFTYQSVLFKRQAVTLELPNKHKVWLSGLTGLRCWGA